MAALALLRPRDLSRFLRRVGAVATVGGTAALLSTGIALSTPFDWMSRGGGAPPPPPGTANIFLSPNGNDAGSRCVRNAVAIANPDVGGTTVCRSYQRAYTLASKGDIVQVASGSYTGDIRNLGSPKPSTGPGCDVYAADTAGCIWFQPAAGATITYAGGLYVQDADYVRLDSIDFGSSNIYIGCNAGTGNCVPAGRIIHGVWIDNSNMSQFFFTSTNGMTLTNSTIGPCIANLDASVCDSQIKANGNSTPDTPDLDFHILIEGNRFHDIYRTATNAHVECMLFFDGKFSAVRRNVYQNCGIIDLFLVSFNPHPMDNVVVENNFFDRPGSNAPTSPSNQTSQALLLSAQGPSMTNILVRNNSFVGGQVVSQVNGGGTVTATLTGNIFGTQLGSCGQTTAGLIITESFEFFNAAGTTCGTNTSRGDPLYAAPLAQPPDLHIPLGSPAVGKGNPGNCPAVDFDNVARTGVCTAGADQP